MAGFDYNAFTKELAKLERGGFRQVRQFSLDVSVLNKNKEFSYECNGLILMPRVLSPDGVELVSDNTVRVWVKLNSKDADPVPLSLIANSQDETSINGTIRTMYLTNLATHAGILYFQALLGVSVSSAAAVGGSSGGGYIPPSGGGGA